MMLQTLRYVTAEWIVAAIAILGVMGTLLVTYIKWQTDRIKIENDINKVDERLNEMERDFKEHLEETERQNRANRDENRVDHHLLFKRLDEIKNYMITGKFPD